MNLPSIDPALINFRSQYQSFVLPFLMLAAIDGYARIRDWRRAPALLALGLFASVLLTARTANDLMVTRWRLDAEQRAAHSLMRQIPGEVAVSANERLAPHLATRRQIFIYPSRSGNQRVRPGRRAGPSRAAGFRLSRDRPRRPLDSPPARDEVASCRATPGIVRPCPQPSCWSSRSRGLPRRRARRGGGSAASRRPCARTDWWRGPR